MTTMKRIIRALICSLLSRHHFVSCFTSPPKRWRIYTNTHLTSIHSSSSSETDASQQSPPQPPPSSPLDKNSIQQATQILTSYDQKISQIPASSTQSYHVSQTERLSLKRSIINLTNQASYERSLDYSTTGRVTLGICSSSTTDALSTLKSWVTSLGLPRGLLHGMDVDGVPITDPSVLGAVYVKYSTGGAMTFAQMRKSGLGFDALWKPGDALMEGYDGEYRGVYFQLELDDGVFRQFGVLPSDLFD